MSADITPENVAKTLARLRATKRPTAKMTAEQDGPGGPWVHKTVYETDPESASDADLLEALAARVAELEAALAKYKDTLCEGFCQGSEWSDNGHHHPHFQADCGGCFAASVLLHHAALAAWEAGKK